MAMNELSNYFPPRLFHRLQLSLELSSYRYIYLYQTTEIRPHPIERERNRHIDAKAIQILSDVGCLSY